VCKGAEEAKAVIDEVMSTKFEHYEVNTFTHYLLTQQEKWKV
jgi:hypothetical protein